jgi:tetratricopeptide (TPR) repeat protein
VPGQENISEIIDRARRATVRRDWVEASRWWEAVRAISPDHAPAYLGAGQALREAGRYDDAELQLGAGAERFPDHEQIAIARAWLAIARRDWPAALSRWEAARVRFPDNPWCYLGNISALRGAGRTDQVETLLVSAETVLAAAKQRGLDSVTQLRAELEIARARLDWPAVQQCAEKIIAREAAPAAQVLLALAQACWHLGFPEEADRAALRAISADPALVEAVLIRAWAATHRGDGETALSCYRTLVELNPGTARWRLKLVQLLDWLGRVKEALSELEDVRRRWPSDPMVRMFLRNYGPVSAVTFGSGNPASRSPDRASGEYQSINGKAPGLAEHVRPVLIADPIGARDQEFQAIAAKAPGPEEHLRPLLVADPDRDVFLAEVTGAKTAVLVFTGAADELTMPLPLFDRYLATLNLTAIYLKDFNRLRYLLGIRSLSRDYQGTLPALRNMLNRLGVKRLCTIGHCVGGFAAIRYGVELCADRILAFNARTSGAADSLMKTDEGPTIMRNRLEANVPLDMADLKPFLQDRRYDARIELFYEEDDPRARMHALRLSGLRGVGLHPHPELSYRLLRRLALLSEDFAGMLAKLLGVGSATSA